MSNEVTNSQKKKKKQQQRRLAKIIIPPRTSSLGKSAKNNNNNNMSFTFSPRESGRDETLAWLETGTLDSLKALLTQRDQAGRQASRGPKTKGAREVQGILQRPSIETVEQLHRAQRRAVGYNFSRSLGWNNNKAAARGIVPSLQLRDVGTLGDDGNGTRSAGPYRPVSWFALGSESGEKSRSATSPVSESGGWRGTDDVADISLDHLQLGNDDNGNNNEVEEKRDSLYSEGNWTDGDFGDEAQAWAVTMTKVSGAEIRQVDVEPDWQGSRSTSSSS
ncbi:hypothetical protein GGS20DRAFT_581452 [Poronia punctata]|nr:hypothetical protein GGS20DRAFT_581452 [Poronia punctata]